VLSAVLIAVGVFCALTVALAALLVIAERFLADYGECAIKINDDREIEVEGGRSLMASLREHEIFLPSACGGRGSCGLCKCRVLAGAGPLLPTETPFLEQAEIDNDVRITCQIKVRGDMAVRIPEEILALREYRCRVDALDRLTHDVMYLRIALADPAEMPFKAGQYVQLVAPPYGSVSEPTGRAYSIASPPSVTDSVELLIRLVPGGIVTTWVFEVLQKDDEVTLTGPFGEFLLQDTDAPCCFVCGATGLAPIRAIIYDMIERGIERPSQLYFGVLARRDLFYHDELTRLADEHDWLEYIPALSQPAEGDAWDGESGLITDVLGRHLTNGADAEGYLCGNPRMIDACIKVMNDKGITEDRIYYDKFA